MLYEFKCTKCGKITEELVKLGTEKIDCPSCGAPAEKILSAPNFIVHGFNAKNSYSHGPKDGSGKTGNPQT